MKIRVLIFSRDRALQLEAALRSFFLHCDDSNLADIRVLYKTTSTRHETQYQELAKTYAGIVNFIQENKFRQDVLNILKPESERFNFHFWRVLSVLPFQLYLIISRGLKRLFEEDSILFLVDDNIFIREFSLRNCAKQLHNHHEVLGFSLRLGKNTSYCYPLEKPQALPSFQLVGGRILKYNWTISENDFAYPLEVSSSLFRLRDIVPLIIGLKFSNPNTLEGRMYARVKKFRKSQPYLLCFEKSVTFCNPLNLVQTVSPNRSSQKSDFSSEALAERFARGERIKIEAYDGLTPISSHQEEPLIFENLEKEIQ